MKKKGLTDAQAGLELLGSWVAGTHAHATISSPPGTFLVSTQTSFLSPFT